MSGAAVPAQPLAAVAGNPLDEFDNYIEALREAGIAVLSDSGGGGGETDSDVDDGGGDDDDIVGDSILVAPRYVDIDAPLDDGDDTANARKHARWTAACMWCAHPRANVTFREACANVRVCAGVRLTLGAYCSPECLLAMAASPFEFGAPDSVRHLARVKRAVRAWARYRVRPSPPMAADERVLMLSVARAHLAPHELALVTDDDGDDDSDGDDDAAGAIASVSKALKAL